MKISYKPLWHVLIDKGMSRRDMIRAVGIGTTTLNKLTHDRVVSIEVIMRICETLDCKVQDVIEFVKD